ncbi:MAG TPA: histidine phosphatase family protein [Dehalococcoidia bacterium]|nr:histidine phosphatase family protein [Dehalococcoidia bacterium]
MTSLYLVRHGQTEHNRGGLALGRADVPLNETGVAQAEAVARALAGEQIAAVYSSPLQRALDTAAAIAAAHELQLVTDDGLIEMDVGDLEGLEYPVLGQKHPEFLEKWLGPEGATTVMPGGESLTAVRDRVWPTVSRLLKAHEGEAVVLVTHNFVILTLLSEYLGLGLANFRRLRHEVAAISRVEWVRGRSVVALLNDTCHLRE